MTHRELRAMIQQEVSETYAGPLPHPSHLAAYEETVPGCGRQIIGAFLDQSKHRQELERAVVLGSERRATRGQFLIFLLVLLVVLIGAAVAWKVDPWAGSAIIGTGLGGGVWLYLAGGRSPSAGEAPPKPE